MPTGRAAGLVSVRKAHFGGTRRADWHFAKHSGAAFGFGVKHFTISDTVFDNTRVSRTLTISPLHTAPSLRAAFNF